MFAQNNLRCSHLESDLKKSQRNWVFLIFNHIKMPSRKAHAITRITNANALAKIGYETVMVAPKRFGAGISVDELYGKLLFKLLLLPFIDLTTMLKKMLGKGFLEQKKVAAPIFYLSMANFVFYLFIYLMIQLLLFRGKKVILLLSEHFLLPIAIISKKVFGSKIVYEFHDPPSQLSRFNLLLLKRLLRNVDLLVTMSYSVALAVEKVFNLHSVVIPHGYEKSKYPSLPIEELRSRLGLPEKAKIILYSGSLFKERKPELMVEGIEILVHRFGFKELILLIVGGGRRGYVSKLQTLAYKKGLSRHVKVVGYVPHNFLPLYLKAADLLLLWEAPFNVNPAKLPEYIGAKKPILAPSIHELSRIVETLNIGLTFKLFDPLDLANKVLRLLTDEQLYEQSIRNLHRIAPYFEATNRARKLLEVLKLRFGD